MKQNICEICGIIRANVAVTFSVSNFSSDIFKIDVNLFEELFKFCHIDASKHSNAKV